MSLTLATFLAIHTNNDAYVRHPNMSKQLLATGQRVAYWQTTLVSYATARRCLPDVTLQVFTNDTEDIEFGDTSLTQLLARLQVERIPLAFSHFKPPQAVSSGYRNTFYRYEVIRALAAHLASGDAAVLLDSDCLWTRPVPDLAERVPQSGFWLTSPYGARPPHLRHPHKLSRADVGDVFRGLDAAYPEPFPTFYGGEFLGARHAAWQTLSNTLDIVWEQVTAESTVPHFANGFSFFDNDEYLMNYIHNSHRYAVTLSDDLLRRILTLEGVNNQRREDETLALWHLPSEKQRGFRLLFDEVVRPDSLFWQTNLSTFPAYLGTYVGIPKRTHDIPRPPHKQIEHHARHLARRLRRWQQERTLQA